MRSRKKLARGMYIIYKYAKYNGNFNIRMRGDIYVGENIYATVQVYFKT